MNMKIYAVYDSAAEQFSPLFEAVNDKVATREYLRVKTATDYPDDYSLWCLGEWQRTADMPGETMIITHQRPVDVPQAAQINLEPEVANG